MRINLKKSPPVTTGKDFRNDLADNFTRIESVINTSDSELITHQTTQIGAHNANQIVFRSETVASKIAHEERKLDNLVLGSNGNGIEEVKDARVSNSGITHTTLARRLDSDYTNFNIDKNEILETVESAKQEILDVEYRFEPETQDFQYLTDLSPFKNAVMQSFYIDNKTNVIYMTQAIDDGYRLSRHFLNGQEIDYMTCVGGSHGTHNGYRYIDNKLYIYSHYKDAENKNKLVRFNYKAGITMTFGSYGMTEVFTGKTDYPYITPIINQKEGLIAYRIEGDNSDGTIYNWVEVRKLTDVDNKVDNILYSITIPQSLVGAEQPMQGLGVANGLLYWYTGNSTVSTPNYLTAFNLKDGRQAFQRRISIGVTDGLVAGDFAEAEGMQFYYDLETGKHALLLGVTVGAPNNRQHQIHGVFQKGVYEKLNAQSSPFSLSDSGGRKKPIPVATTTLSDIKSPGSYYITTAESKLYVDFPMPSNWFSSGWSLDVDFPNYAGDTTQTLSMNIFSGTQITFKRMVSFTSVGSWTYVPLYNQSAGIRIPTAITKLSQFNIAGMTMYMTLDDSSRMTDFPRNDGVAGWWIENGMADTGGGFVQTVKRNSTNVVEIYIRTITGTGVANRWSVLKPEII